MKIKEFYPNEDDDLHCLQSCVRMILSAEETEPLSLSAAEELTGYRLGEQTWPYEMMLSFANRQFEVLSIETVDQMNFLLDPASAIISVFGEELWKHMLDVSDVERARKVAEACSKHPEIHFEKRVPNFQDISKLINQGWWIIVNVNANKLMHKDGYNGHFVLVDMANTAVILQNPGLPPIENQRVSREHFMEAWYYPSEKAANIVAFRNKKMKSRL